MTAPTELRAWRPPVPGIVEVFHAHFVDHAYPTHTHDTWTLLIVDDGVIRYDLDRTHHDAVTASVTLLPPEVPHDGSSATADGFHKRVLYLDTSVLGAELIGVAVDQPTLVEPLLRHRLDQLHRVLSRPGEALEAESRLAFVAERVRRRLSGREVPPPPAVRGLPDQLRQLLDAAGPHAVTLRHAATSLEAHPTHLVRTFTRQYGLPPHRYLIGRRIDEARKLLLAGRPAAEVAAAVGFYDQAHLTRHFRRYLGVSPGRYAASAPTDVAACPL
jgi:AraC-like DNA-binding protein